VDRRPPDADLDGMHAFALRDRRRLLLLLSNGLFLPALRARWRARYASNPSALPRPRRQRVPVRRPMAMTMEARSMLLERPAPVSTRPLRADPAAPRAPEAGEILLRVRACAVCRTDLQIVEGELSARRLPIVPGHQITGRVVAVG